MTLVPTFQNLYNPFALGEQGIDIETYGQTGGEASFFNRVPGPIYDFYDSFAAPPNVPPVPSSTLETPNMMGELGSLAVPYLAGHIGDAAGQRAFESRGATSFLDDLYGGAGDTYENAGTWIDGLFGSTPQTPTYTPTLPTSPTPPSVLNPPNSGVSTPGSFDPQAIWAGEGGYADNFSKNLQYGGFQGGALTFIGSLGLNLLFGNGSTGDALASAAGSGVGYALGNAILPGIGGLVGGWLGSKIVSWF